MKKTSKLLDKPYATVHKVVTSYQQEHPDEKTIQVNLWLRIDNNNKFVRGKTESRRLIEDVVLSKYRMNKPDKKRYNYTLTITYTGDEELERIIYDDIFRRAYEIAELRNGFVEADVREVGGLERSWSA
jgi:hypothetical protein